VKTVDGNGNATTYAANYYLSPTPPMLPVNYQAPSGGSTFAFFTTITDPLNHATSLVWDQNIGKPILITDPNFQATTADYSDPFDRLKKVSYPDGGSTSYTYLDSINTVTTTTALTPAADLFCAANGPKVDDRIYDGLGRESQRIGHEAIGTVVVQTNYDAMGRAYEVSNPYVSGSGPYWTTTSYDPLSRVIQVQTLDLANANTGYAGNTVNGKWRQSQGDALGRLVHVIEDPAASLTLPNGTPIQNSPVATATTTYSYDALDSLLQVNQSGQMRTFAYDSLKRLVCASNPETRVGAASCPLSSSGVDRYAYDANSNLATHTNTMPITTTMVYDKLNRLIQKAYSDNTTPTVNLCYDGYTTATPSAGGNALSCNGATSLANVNAVGHLTWEGNPNSSTGFLGFDAMGRVTGHAQTTGSSSPYVFQYAYSQGGQMEFMKYPSGRQVVTCYDVAGRVSGVAKGLAPAPFYANVTQYTPHGAIAQLGLGNGVQENTSYSFDRLQPSSITAAYGGATLLSLGYSYCPTGAASCGTNNGNLLSQQITATEPARSGVSAQSLSWQQLYGYDTLNRLTTVAETLQSAILTKEDDLRFFTKEICGIEYVHVTALAPTADILDAYKKHKGDWRVYEEEFLDLMRSRRSSMQERRRNRLRHHEPPVPTLGRPPGTGMISRNFRRTGGVQSWGGLTQPCLAGTTFITRFGVFDPSPLLRLR
jgi:YD repeat-containing protein